jgi:hypothetical protein
MSEKITKFQDDTHVTRTSGSRSFDGGKAGPG